MSHPVVLVSEEMKALEKKFPQLAGYAKQDNDFQSFKKRRPSIAAKYAQLMNQRQAILESDRTQKTEQANFISSLNNDNPKKDFETWQAECRSKNILYKIAPHISKENAIQEKSRLSISSEQPGNQMQSTQRKHAMSAPLPSTSPPSPPVNRSKSSTSFTHDSRPKASSEGQLPKYNSGKFLTNILSTAKALLQGKSLQSTKIAQDANMVAKLAIDRINPEIQKGSNQQKVLPEEQKVDPNLLSKLQGLLPQEASAANSAAISAGMPSIVWSKDQQNKSHNSHSPLAAFQQDIEVMTKKVEKAIEATKPLSANHLKMDLNLLKSISNAINSSKQDMSVLMNKIDSIMIKSEFERKASGGNNQPNSDTTIQIKSMIENHRKSLSAPLAQESREHVRHKR